MGGPKGCKAFGGTDKRAAATLTNMLMTEIRSSDIAIFCVDAYTSAWPLVFLILVDKEESVKALVLTNMQKKIRAKLPKYLTCFIVVSILSLSVQSAS